MVIPSLILFAAAVLAAAEPGRRLPAVPRPALPSPEGPPPVASSYLHLPVSIRVAPLGKALDRAFPTELAGMREERTADTEEGQPVPGGPVRYRHRIWRDPFRVSMNRDSLFARANLSYTVEGSRADVGTVRCGTESEPYTAEFGALARMGWDETGGLESVSQNLATVYRLRCKPKPPAVNFTKLVNDRLEERIGRRLPAVLDSVVRTEPATKQALARVWKALVEPVAVSKDGPWLSWNARAVRSEPLSGSGSGDALVAHQAFEVAPEFVSAPGASASASTVPDPRVRVAGGNVAVPFDCWIPFDSLAADVALSGANLMPGPSGERVLVRAARVTGGREQLAIELDVTGAIEGTLHLVGTPRVAIGEYIFEAPDLDYTKESVAAVRKTLGGKAKDMLEGPLTDVRRAASGALRRTLTPCITSWDAAIGRCLNRTLPEGVKIQGGINYRSVHDVFCTDREVGVRFVASGRGELSVP